MTWTINKLDKSVLISFKPSVMLIKKDKLSFFKSPVSINSQNYVKSTFSRQGQAREKPLAK